jgi:hypothetical protein
VQGERRGEGEGGVFHPANDEWELEVHGAFTPGPAEASATARVRRTAGGRSFVSEWSADVTLE